MPEHGSPGYPPRLRLLIASALALPVVAGAVVSLALDPPGLAEGLAIALFLGLALLAELKPVPLEEDDLSTVSLAFVFILAGVILFGWNAGVIIAAVSALVAQLVERSHSYARCSTPRSMRCRPSLPRYPYCFSARLPSTTRW